MTFNIIKEYKNLCDSEINCIVFHSSYLYYLNSEGNDLGVIEFDKAIDQHEFSSRELTKCEEACKNSSKEITENKQEEPKTDQDDLETLKNSMFDNGETIAQRLQSAQIIS